MTPSRRFAQPLIALALPVLAAAVLVACATAQSNDAPPAPPPVSVQSPMRTALAQYEKPELAAIADVEAAVAAYRTSTQRVMLLAARRDSAARALEIAEARYAAGAIDGLVRLDAQRVRREAAMKLAAAVAAHRIAVVELYRAVGGPVLPGAG